MRYLILFLLSGCVFSSLPKPAPPGCYHQMAALSRGGPKRCVLVCPRGDGTADVAHAALRSCKP